LVVFCFVWYCSFFPVAEKTNQKKLVASIAMLQVLASLDPTEATGYALFILSVDGVYRYNKK